MNDPKHIRRTTRRMVTFLRRHLWKIAPISAVVILLLALNLSTAFAKTVCTLPYIGRIAKVFCMEEYQHEDTVSSLHIRVPNIQVEGGSALENQVNAEIKKRVEDMRKALEQDAEELQKAYDEQGSSATMQMENIIDYKVTAQKGDVLSFQIILTQKLNTSYQEFQTYNLNLKTKEPITLQDLFGDDYEAEINGSIREMIRERQQQDENNLYFSDDMGFQGIRDDTLFYINEHGEVVIFFKKYEIAPGYMGIQEFPLSCRKAQEIMNGK